jgi:hypothetical protein
LTRVHRGQLAGKQLLLEVLDVMPQQQLLAQQQDSVPAAEQQLLQRIVQTLLFLLVRTSRDDSVLGVDDLAQLLLMPTELSAQERQGLLTDALLWAADRGEGVESSGFHEQLLNSCRRACCALTTTQLL